MKHYFRKIKWLIKEIFLKPMSYSVNVTLSAVEEVIDDLINPE